mmetsp:Transcript_32970/g.51540  ORF Transcript_32970/g.51540 Transcript_32970/m.51540 type:complete len:291 (-) Transcript_32970:286-1158(-)
MTDNSRPTGRVIAPKSQPRWVLLRIAQQRQRRKLRWYERYYFPIAIQNLSSILFFLLACLAFGFNDSWTVVGLKELRSHYALRDPFVTKRAIATITALKEPSEVQYAFQIESPEPDSQQPLSLGRGRFSFGQYIRDFFFEDLPQEENEYDFRSFWFGFFSWLDSPSDLDEDPKFSCHRFLGTNDRWGLSCHLPPELFELAAKKAELEIVYMEDAPSFNAPVDEKGVPIDQPCDYYVAAFLAVALFLVDVQLGVGMVLSVVWLWSYFWDWYTPPPPRPEPVYQLVRVMPSD